MRLLSIDCVGNCVYLIAIILFAFQKHFRGSDIPLLMVACKSEQSHVAQKYDLSPEDFCKHNRLPPPQFYSAISPTSSNLYSMLATMAAHP